jgi:hypothetical protein
MISLAQSIDTPVAMLGIRPIDLAAFLALGFVWIFVLAMLYGIYKILRSKARGEAGWGDSPGL